jgi:mRNA-degrading endonuclease toxin of MazEF toxin-antitoxin module
MPSTITYERGRVVVVTVPFSDQSGVKSRPALVVSAGPFNRELPDIIVGQISSQPRYYRRPGPGDCPLREWRAAGLRYPSTARISKILAGDKQIVRRALEPLSPGDLARVDTLLRAAFGFQ